MSANVYTEAMPVGLRWLGVFRRQFEASGSGALSAITRGLVPMAVAAILIAAGETWLVPRNWKYYILCAVAAAIFLNGLRVVIQAWRCRQQKVAIFEHGFALWRNGSHSAFRWDQIEEVEVGESFLGFAVICRTDDGQRTKLRFDAGADPTRDLRDLWRELGEQLSRHRILAALKMVDAEEEAVFVQNIWGKEVGTKIAVSWLGIRATFRFGDTRFLEWSQVAAVRVDAERLIVTEKKDGSPWLNESVMETPGYVALVAAANHAQQAYLELAERLGRDRIPALLEALDTGQELIFGSFSVSLRGVRYESELTDWNDVLDVRMERDHLAVRAYPADRRLDYGALSLADRLTLRAVVERALERAEADDEDEEGEMEDDLD